MSPPNPALKTPPPRNRGVLVTRGSALALWQAEHVAALLKDLGLGTDRLVVKTTADRIQDRFLHEIGGKGLFIKELEEALLARTADLAVHSLKDLPVKLAPEFLLAAVLPRHSPADCLILRKDIAARFDHLDQSTAPGLTAKAVALLGDLTVGTGSLRRQAILAQQAPELRPVGIRGNVDTRLRRLAAGDFDGIILAEASLDRLGIHDVARFRLAPEWFIPSAAQGALAIETRAEDPLAAWLDGALGCPATRQAVTFERSVLAALGGDCTLPFGCHAHFSHGAWHARAALWTGKGAVAVAAVSQPAAPGEAWSPTLLADMLQQLKANGAAAVLRTLGLEVPPRFV